MNSKKIPSQDKDCHQWEFPLRVEKNHELKSSTLVQTTKSFKNSFYSNKIAFTFITFVTFLYYWKNSFQMKISEMNQCVPSLPWANAIFYASVKEG